MAEIPDILRKIMDRKAVEVAECRQRRSFQALEAEVAGAALPRGLADALWARAASGQQEKRKIKK